MKKIRIYLMILIFLCSSIVFADPKQELHSKLQDYVDHWRLANNIPAMAITIDHPQLGIVTVVAGTQKEGSKEILTAANPFQIGSITKTFVAAIILQLEAQGKLSIDDKIVKWFPQYPSWKEITIRQLLNMSSGIFQYGKDPVFEKIKNDSPNKQWIPSELTDVSYKHPLYFQPGSGWHYSNANYILAGQIIEKITHQRLAEVLQSFINSKSLVNTAYVSGVLNGKLAKQMIHGYRDQKDITFDNISTYGAAGAMVSTSRDIATWTKALFEGAIIPKAQLAELMTTVPFDPPPNTKPKGSRYGLGVYLVHSKKYGDIWWYSGVTNGYISLFMYLPQTQLIVTSTINRIQGDNYWVLMPDHPLPENVLALANAYINSERKNMH